MANISKIKYWESCSPLALSSYALVLIHSFSSVVDDVDFNVLRNCRFVVHEKSTFWFSFLWNSNSVFPSSLSIVTVKSTKDYDLPVGVVGFVFQI